MSEQITENEGAGGEGGEPNGFKPITSQEEFNAALKDRITRERAKFADYADLKTKAAKLDQIEQANKSESEKTAERIAALETELTSTRTTALRTRIAADFGISTKGEDGSPSDADLFLTATDEATLIRQAERLAGRAADRKKQGNHVPGEGTTQTQSKGKDGKREWLASLRND